MSWNGNLTHTAQSHTQTIMRPSPTKQQIYEMYSIFLWTGEEVCLYNEIAYLVQFKKKKNSYNLLTPMSSKISMSFFLQSKRN